MKKLLLSLGFAAGTVLCVNAQEVTPQEEPLPQEEQTLPQEQQTLPQEQPQTQPEMTQEQPEVPQEQTQSTQEQPEMAQEETDQQQGMESQEGITMISKEELPKEVQDGLASSEFSEATVEQAYELTGEAIPTQLLEQEDAADPDVDSADQKFYQLQVNQDDQPSILYFDEQGELLETQSM